MSGTTRRGVRCAVVLGLAFVGWALPGCEEAHRQPYEHHEGYRAPARYEEHHGDGGRHGYRGHGEGEHRRAYDYRGGYHY